LLPIGASPWIWASPITDADLAKLVPRMAGWGFDAIELPLENPGDWDPARTRDLLAAHRLTAAAVIAVMSPDRSLVDTDGNTVATTRTYLRACLDAAVAVGAPVVAGPIYAPVGRTWQMSGAQRAETYRDWRAGLAPVAAHAAASGVHLGVEALNRYETSVVNTVAQALEALGDLPATGLMLDSYHMNIEEADPYAAITAAAGRIVHVQVSGSDRGTPGADHIDWPRWIRTLLATGYRRPVCIESFTGDNAMIAVAASIWRPLAPTQDRLASDGLAFLRRTFADVDRH
jgi:D-psicose/D-tagatose/L-ribulose 3-epimerase